MKSAGKVILVLVLLYMAGLFALQARASAAVDNASTQSAPTVQRGAQVFGPVVPAVSMAARDLPAADFTDPVLMREVNPMRHGGLLDRNAESFGRNISDVRDPLLDVSVSDHIFTPGLNFSFEGINNLAGVLPPDTNGDVGPNHYVQMVNFHFQIWDKTGAPLTAPALISTLFATSGNSCATNNSGDPIVIYDDVADRWLLSQFEVNTGNNVCIAISTTNDPTGSYYLYRFTTPRFPDYYKIGAWPDAANNAYYMGTNSGFQFQYDVFALERADMLAGLPATMQFFQSYESLHLPADVDGTTPPPANSPGYFYTFVDGGEPYFGSPPTDAIRIYEFDVDWTTPANTTYTLAQEITAADGRPLRLDGLRFLRALLAATGWGRA